MGVRRLIVEIDTSSVDVRAFCAQHGISTWFFYDLRRRYAAEGEAALTPKSRAPHRVANKTTIAVEEAIVAKRKELQAAGLDGGAETIAFHLRDTANLPAVSTIYRILRARGFVDANPRKRPKSAHRSFTAARANECWQLDDTTWALADGTEVKIFNVIDDHSRLLVASTAMTACTGQTAITAVSQAAATLGWPQRFLSDNAGVFRHLLADALGSFGVAAGHSRPRHPQTNGKVERFHQTLKKWLVVRPRAETIADLQAELDAFRHLYNHERAHRSVDRRFPADVWTAAPKAGPADRPITPPTAIFRGVVIHGRVLVGDRRHATIGAAYDGQRALAVVTGTACHIFIDGRLVRALTIDLSRRYQPLNERPKPPPTV